MSATKNFSEFTNKYPLTKTLRFELKPVGKTIETMHKWAEELRHESEKVPSENNLLFQDEVRSADYKKVKKLIDEKHKHFIDDALNEFSFLKEDLYTFQTFYFKTDKTSDESDAFDELKSKMRKAIGACFKKKNVKELENKKLITDLLPNFINTHWDEPMAIRLKEHGIENKDQALELIEKFKYFTTYFTGFHQNRQNMYADEEKSTAIAFRLVHENLPKFLDNLSLYSKIIEKYPDLDFSIIETELEDVFQRIRVKELFSLDFFNECLTQTGIERYLIALGGRSEEGQKKIQGINEYVNLYRQQNQLKKTQLGNFSRLFKQILSDRESVSFIPESFKNDKEVLDSIHHFFNEELLNWHHNGASRSLFDALIDLFQHLDEADLNKVYVQNGTPLSSLSNQV
ncbi:MAG: type V CRISPR-associated protein Cas12a/Cpf1, partial [Flavobacteriales bacterium]|nr:type V CRISPR-associated protein Cas12a/Cpf1 [Flavobacteriales bacterium]